MRQRFVREFDGMWFDSMNGDSRETGKLTPGGDPDPSVFSAEFNREGIRVGTMIGLMVRKTRSTANHQPPAKVWFRNFWGSSKRANLVSSLQSANFGGDYLEAVPTKSNRYSFRPSKITGKYESWPKLTDLCSAPPMNGLMEKRGGALMDTDKAVLEKRMVDYYDLEADWDSLKLSVPALTKNAARFEARKARRKITQAEQFEASHLVRYALRPFDNRWAYYSPTRPLWNEPRPELWNQYAGGTQFLMSRPAGVAQPEGVPLFLTRALGDNDFLRGHAYYIPLQLRPPAEKKKKHHADQHSLLPEAKSVIAPQTANLSPSARNYSTSLGFQENSEAEDASNALWLHILAIGYCSAYLTENPDGISQDWLRIPLPDSRATILASAQLGHQIAMLLDTESPVKCVTDGELRAELKPIASITRVGGGHLEETEIPLTAGWGHSTKDGATMPGKGKLVGRPFSKAELNAIKHGANEMDLSEKEALTQIGESTCDVYLNEVAYWSNVPIKVWEYTIGGYQVIKKWLSYREEPLLGRTLTKDEVRYVQEVARRIAAILLLGPALNANYELIKRHTFPWPPKP